MENYDIIKMVNEYMVIFVMLVFIIMSVIVTAPIINKRRNILGRAPVNKFFYLLAKLFLVIPILMAILQITGKNFSNIEVTTWMHITSIILLVISTPIIFLSMLKLWTSTRMGLPNEKTELKTTGIYKISRNPLYIGIFLWILGTTIYIMNIYVLIMFIISLIIHHFIVLSEENFLKINFGKDYLDYQKQTRRYI